MTSTEEPDLPRAQVGPEPQRLLTVLLRDYWYWRSEPIPSRVLVNVLGQFGISDLSARAAMRRLTARGLLSVQRSGRTTAYGNPPRAGRDAIRRIGVDDTAVLRSELHTPGNGAVVAKAFDGTVLSGYYREFIDTYAPVTELARQGRVSPHQALLLRTACILDWRQATVNDPVLPDALLPADWPLAEARQCAVDIYDSLGPFAAERFRQLLAAADPDLAGHVQHHTVADVMGLAS